MTPGHNDPPPRVAVGRPPPEPGSGAAPVSRRGASRRGRCSSGARPTFACGAWVRWAGDEETQRRAQARAAPTSGKYPGLYQQAAPTALASSAPARGNPPGPRGLPRAWEESCRRGGRSQAVGPKAGPRGCGKALGWEGRLIWREELANARGSRRWGELRGSTQKEGGSLPARGLNGPTLVDPGT